MKSFCSIFAVPLVVATFVSSAHAADVLSEQIEWQAENDTDTRTIKFGQLTVRLSRHPKPSKTQGYAFTQIQISAPGTQAAAFHAENAFGPGATVQFAEFDAKNRFPEILFSTYSGGAHCCFGTMVLTFNGKKWVRVPEDRVADGAAPKAQDIDKDGRAEITEPDGAFLYEFAGYAGSVRPVRIYQLAGTKWVDVSRKPGFRSFHSADPKDIAKACDKNFQRTAHTNGFWAGYVASEALAGRRKHAWQKMLQCYDRDSNWGLCAEPGETDCKKRVREFPDALRKFLRANNYW